MKTGEVLLEAGAEVARRCKNGGVYSTQSRRQPRSGSGSTDAVRARQRNKWGACGYSP